jgi:site-specific DNA-cytosine methylase
VSRALSLFSGIGLHDLGLERAGWQIAGQVEIDPWCREVLAKHWPAVQRWEDVSDVTAKSLSGLGGIELVTGGFPCQNISSAGRGVGLLRGERSSLWLEMLRIIRGVHPAWVLAENVPALRTRGIDSVLAGLEEAGYAAWPVVVGAWTVGAPHRRDRVWIVGRRLGQPDDGDAARVLPRSGEGEGPVFRGPQEGPPGRRASAASGVGMGNLNSPRREGTGTEAHEGRQGSSDGRGAGMAHAHGGALRLESGRIVGEGRTGEAEPGGGGERLADADRHLSRADRGEPLSGTDRSHNLARGNSGGRGIPCWPARRGEPQHAWEPPRLVESGLGRGLDGRAARLDGFARRHRLKALGNANPPFAPELIGRWMLSLGGVE